MVIDASAAISWFLPTQTTASALALLDRRTEIRFVAARYFAVEFRSVMLRAESREWISADDSLYLASALDRGLPLASRDGRLIDAAKGEGVDVLDLRG